MHKDKIIEKIRKCLALSSSANQHEAAAALRQAQKMMELHRVSDTDLLAAGVGEASSHAGASRRPSNWEGLLATMISLAFGCRIVFVSARGGGNWRFIGMGASAEIAQYAFAVLFRQLRRSRATFIKEKCKRLIPASKTRRADLFCLAWVREVEKRAQAMAAASGATEAISAYMLAHYPNLTNKKMRERNADRSLRRWRAPARSRTSTCSAQARRSTGTRPTRFCTTTPR